MQDVTYKQNFHSRLMFHDSYIDINNGLDYNPKKKC